MAREYWQVLFLLVCLLEVKAAPDTSECDSIATEFVRKRPHLSHFPPNLPHREALKFVYFLHVPRTAGRSFNSCFLHKAFPPSHRCAASYSAFRLEISAPRCQVLSSHDDYSVTDFLPRGASVISQFRDPVDRFISAYEFAIEVAARGLMKVRKLNETRELHGVNTRDVWPWSYLIPYFDEDLTWGMKNAQEVFKRGRFQREGELPNWVPAMHDESGAMYYFHRKTRQSKWKLTDVEIQDSAPMLDPYNNSLIMPLQEFLEEPVASDLIINGMTFQVLGITNYSYWPEAEQVRNCMMISKSAERTLMEFAKRRVDSLVHVSLTSELKESVQSLAGALGLHMDGPIWKDSKNELRRTKVEKNYHDLMDRLLNLTGSFSSVSNQYIMDLTIKAYSFLMKDRFVVKTLNVSDITDAEYSALLSGVQKKTLLFRSLQSETLRRRKEADNDSIVPFPRLPLDDKFELDDRLWSFFAKCDDKRKKVNRVKRYKSLQNIFHPDERKIHFTKDARARIPESVIQKIREHNWLDVELYQYALKAYRKQIEQQIKQGIFARRLPDVIIPPSTSVNPTKSPFFKQKPQALMCPAEN